MFFKDANREMKYFVNLESVIFFKKNKHNFYP